MCNHSKKMKVHNNKLKLLRFRHNETDTDVRGSSGWAKLNDATLHFLLVTVLFHHHLLLASSVNSGLFIFTCNFSVMSTCNTGHLSEKDYSCLGVL